MLALARANDAPSGRPDLSIEGLSVSFGGLDALRRLDLHAAAGTITGLIGPNGAGKTTTFNACTGIVTPSEGGVRLGQRDLTGLSAARRARAGLGRTFQRMELWDSMTVSENVAVACEARIAGRHVWGQLVSTRRERATVARVTAEAMQTCGISDLAPRTVGALSTGDRRLVELARAVAGQFDFLLLDEPSSGLDVPETERFGEILVSLARDDGIGILLVEHDMALVRRTCARVYVLDFGRLICHGDRDDVLRSDVVRAAYLGSEATV